MQSSWHISSGVEGSAHEAKVIALIQALQDKEVGKPFNAQCDHGQKACPN